MGTTAGRQLPHHSARPGPSRCRRDKRRAPRWGTGAAEVLCRDGTPVQLGIAAGNVVHVTDEMAPQDLPSGGIAVARVASPQLRRS